MLVPQTKGEWREGWCVGAGVGTSQSPPVMEGGGQRQCSPKIDKGLLKPLCCAQSLLACLLLIEVFLYNPGWLWTCSPPALTSRNLGLQVCATTIPSYLWLGKRSNCYSTVYCWNSNSNFRHRITQEIPQILLKNNNNNNTFFSVVVLPPWNPTYDVPLPIRDSFVTK